MRKYRILSGIILQRYTKCVNNDSHRFVYDRGTRQFSEIKYGRTVGQYTFEEFDQLVKDRGMVGEFSPYEFRIEKG